ncbi:MAG: septum formation protein Maf [Hungatella hathewayi]|nr:septum formation protein Maf [Hungatella hathewayi]
MEIKNLILASGSPRRKELLEQIGIMPVISPSRIEEVVTSSVPEQVVLELSSQKAEDVMSRCPVGSVVLGADTVVAIDGMILGKPKSHGEACEMIRRIQGRSHQVHTGVAILLKEETGLRQKHFTVKTDVMVFPMTEEEIREYGESEEPMDKAGAYAIQGRFAAYIQGISGDYSNVVGLPVGRVYQELKALLENREDESHD